MDSEGVEAAVVKTLQDWLPPALDEIYSQHQDPNAPPYPGSWQSFDVLERWPEQAMPAILVSVGEARDVELNGEWYNARYPITVMVICAGADYPDTRLITRRYLSAIVIALAQQGDLGGIASSTRWETTSKLSAGQAPKRTIDGGSVTFITVVERVLRRYSDLVTPPAPGVPPDGLPQVHEIDITVQGVPS